MSRTLETAMKRSRKGPGLRPPQRPPDDAFFARQLDALRRHRSNVERILAEARRREADVEAAFATEAAKIRDLFGPAAGPRADAERAGALRVAKRRRNEALRAAFDETQQKLSAEGLAARELLAATDAVRRSHLDPFTALRRARRGPGEKTLSEVEAMAYRAAVVAVARAAPYNELRGMAQGFLDDGDLVGLHSVLLALEDRKPTDRPIDPGDLRAAVPLPELAAQRERAAEVFDEGRAILAAWADYASPPDGPPRSGTGRRRIAGELARRADDELSVIGRELELLASTRAPEVRDLSDGTARFERGPENAARAADGSGSGGRGPSGAGRLAHAIQGGQAPTETPSPAADAS